MPEATPRASSPGTSMATSDQAPLPTTTASKSSYKLATRICLPTAALHTIFTPILVMRATSRWSSSGGSR